MGTLEQMLANPIRKKSQYQHNPKTQCYCSNPALSCTKLSKSRISAEPNTAPFPISKLILPYRVVKLSNERNTFNNKHSFSRQTQQWQTSVMFSSGWTVGKTAIIQSYTLQFIPIHGLAFLTASVKHRSVKSTLLLLGMYWIYSKYYKIYNISKRQSV